MSHPTVSDEDLILLLYGEMEADDAHRLGERIDREDDLRERYEALAAALDRVDEAWPVPEPAEDWEARQWRRLAPRLSRPWYRRLLVDSGHGSGSGTRGLGRWHSAPRLALGTAVAASAALLLTFGYVAGRWSAPPPDSSGSAPTTSAGVTASDGAGLSEQARQRLLEGALTSHLEGSQRLLASLANSAEPADLVAERDWAAALLLSNRLYRRAAERSGQRRIAALLGELEPMLLELSHLPPELADDDAEDIQRRIEDRDLLFKLRVMQSPQPL